MPLLLRAVRTETIPLQVNGLKRIVCVYPEC